MSEFEDVNRCFEPMYRVFYSLLPKRVDVSLLWTRLGWP